MIYRNSNGISKLCLGACVPLLLTATLALGVEPNTRNFTSGEQVKLDGVVVSRDGNVLKVRDNSDAIGTVDLTAQTKIALKHGIFGQKTAMDVDKLVPGLQVEAQGKGNEKGELVATKVTFDPNSMRASRQIDTRVSPLEARTGTLEGRTGTLENRANTLEGRAGKIEGRQGELEDQERQTQQQVGQVKQTADQATQGVTDVNQRVTNLDNYQEKLKEVVYFRTGSSILSSDDKQKLDDLAKQASNEKGYVIEVAGFADKRGSSALNQTLSENRANAVIRYLEQNGNIPIHRILTPAGMGTTHEAAENTTAQGRKMNRRVEVTILVNQGMVAGASQTGGTTTKPQGDASK